jgi:2-(1,2-epoxy-1,2-dihydrophenyl)acetyl-CoA isomerase
MSKQTETRCGPDLLVEDVAAVRLFRLNRPDRFNALSRGLCEALAEALRAAADDPAVRCVVITGQGKAFCAGGDVGVQAADSDAKPAAAEVVADGLRNRMESVRLLHTMPKPTIAMINGVAAGAGMSLALACDMRVAGDRARMTTAFGKVGLCGDYAGSYFLTALVGPAMARELYFLSPMLEIDRLVALGLVNRRASQETLLEQTMALAAELARGPSLAYRYMKNSLNTALHATLEQTMAAEVFGTMRTLDSLDHREGARAFMEKRPPEFRGL